MEDDQIIQLYWDRDEGAIPATADRYGPYCAAIARNILDDRLDTEECVNDTYLHAWNAMPPQWPQILSAFLGKITRNLALSRYRHRHAEKRGGGELTAVLQELEDCVSGQETVEQQLEQQELEQALHAFLTGLSPEKRGMFVCRYWYTDSVSDIAARYHLSRGAVTMQLSRMRKNLRTFLLERGISV